MSNESNESNELVVFVAPSISNLTITVPIGDIRKKLQFDHHRLEVDQETAEVLRAAIKKTPALQSKIKEVNKSAAEALAKAHMKSRQGGAISGGFNSGHVRQLQSRDENLRHQGVSEADLSKLRTDLAKDSNLILTEKAAPKPIQVSDETAATPVKLNALLKK